MRVRESMEGKRFGRFTVIGESDDRKRVHKGVVKRYRVLVVRCDCGTVKAVVASHLKSGAIKSCGCWHKEWASQLKKGFGKGRLTLAGAT